MTVEEGVRSQIKEEIGDAEIPQSERFIILQKFGIAKAVLDRRLDNPGWVPETSTEKGADTWTRRKQNWVSMINQAKKARR